MLLIALYSNTLEISEAVKSFIYFLSNNYQITHEHAKKIEIDQKKTENQKCKDNEREK